MSRETSTSKTASRQESAISGQTSFANTTSDKMGSAIK